MLTGNSSAPRPSAAPETVEVPLVDDEAPQANGNAHRLQATAKFEGVPLGEDEDGLTDPNNSRSVNEPRLAIRRELALLRGRVHSPKDQLAHARCRRSVFPVYVVGKDPPVHVIHRIEYAKLYYGYVTKGWLKVLRAVNMLTGTPGTHPEAVNMLIWGDRATYAGDWISPASLQPVTQLTC